MPRQNEGIADVSLLAGRLREHRRFVLRLVDEMSTEDAKRCNALAADLAIAAAVVAADFERAPQAAYAAELAVARRMGVGNVMRALCDAVEVGGVSASRLAETLGYSIGDLHGDGLQRVANMTVHAAEGDKSDGI